MTSGHYLGVPSPHSPAPFQGDIAASGHAPTKSSILGGELLSKWQEPGLGGLAFRTRAAPLLPMLSPHQLVQQLSLGLQDHFEDLPRGPQLGRGPECCLPYCQGSPLLVFLRLGDIISTQQPASPRPGVTKGLDYSSDATRAVLLGSFEEQRGVSGRQAWSQSHVCNAAQSPAARLCGAGSQWFPGTLVS